MYKTTTPHAHSPKQSPTPGWMARKLARGRTHTHTHTHTHTQTAGGTPHTQFQWRFPWAFPPWHPGHPHLHRRCSSGPRVRRLVSGSSPTAGARPSSSADAALSPRKAPKSREQTEMKPRSGRDVSGKCSPAPRRPWLASQVARRPSPLTQLGSWTRR